MQTVDTVRGPLPIEDLGVTLMHEHILAKCRKDQYPLAVDYAVSELMRARRGDRSPVHLTDGPGKLCQALAIDRRFDRADLCAPQATLFLEKGTAVDESDIVATPRVGVSGDETAKNALWRFCLRHNQHVSRRC